MKIAVIDDEQRYMDILGDWIQDFSYAVFDGENMFLEQYVEGETKL